MDIKTMPKDTLAELLSFLAEHEEFASVQQLLADGITVEEVRSGLRELADGLRREAAFELDKQYNAQKDTRLTKEAKTIISYLSPGEEKALLTAFGLIAPPPVLRPAGSRNPSPPQADRTGGGVEKSKSALSKT